jgi:D-lactate dehydrogenase (cytochrome)
LHEIMSEVVIWIPFSEVARVKGRDTIQAKYSSYLSDESKLKADSCDYIFFPKNEAEIAAVVCEMSRLGVPLTVSGARTGLVGGSVPSNGALMSLERLDRVKALYFDIYAKEWRVRAQCGVSLANLKKMISIKRFPDIESSSDPALLGALSDFQQETIEYIYPPDPTEMSASLGGTVATNASGARTYRYGPTRDWVRAIRVVLPNGERLEIPRGKYFASTNGSFTITDTQGQRRQLQIPDYPMPRTKNTAGFYAAPHMDLIDLFIGAEGMLGIITLIEVALCAHEPKCSIMLFADSDEQAIALVESLRSQSGLPLDLLEFYSQKAIDLLRERQAQEPSLLGMPPLPEQAVAAVFIELSFDPLAERLDFSQLAEAVERVGLSLDRSWAGYELRELARFKALRHALPETVNHLIAERKRKYPGLHKLGTDLAVPDDKLQPMWDVYRQELDLAGLHWLAFGHVGNNHLHINIIPQNLDQMQKGLEAYSRLSAQAVAFGGTVSAEHGIGKLKAKFLKEMFSERDIAGMKAVKLALDPHGLLNPGNIFLD